MDFIIEIMLTFVKSANSIFEVDVVLKYKYFRGLSVFQSNFPILSYDRRTTQKRF